MGKIKFVEINGIKFYYDSSEIVIDSKLWEKLESFEGEEESYTLYIDKNQGLVIS